MSTEIAVAESAALKSHRAATNAAGLCRELVVKTASKIQGKRYVQVEGWQAIANTFGCVASAKNVERVEGGFRATGQVVRLSDGTVIAEAEGFVGDDEKTWASRPVFARRAMAQTRAMSRACRSAFAFVVTLMDAGLETTPAEEMTHVDAEFTPERDRQHASEPVAVRPKFDDKWSGSPPAGTDRVQFKATTPTTATPVARGGYSATVTPDGEIVAERQPELPAANPLVAQIREYVATATPDRLKATTRRIDALVAEGKLTTQEWESLTDAIAQRMDETTVAVAAAE